jgi:hypothetical protein
VIKAMYKVQRKEEAKDLFAAMYKVQRKEEAKDLFISDSDVSRLWSALKKILFGSRISYLPEPH